MFESHMEMIGKPHVPEEKHSEFCERMLTLFKEAGLMDYETVMLAEKSIYLLKEPEFDENDILSCEYSVYDFEWKDALRFSGDALVLRTGYIGYKKFSKAAKAAFMLWELYSDTDCISGSIDDWHCVKECVGWINYIFNETYQIPHRDDYIKIYKDTDCSEPIKIMSYVNDGRLNGTRLAAEFFGLQTAYDGVDAAINESFVSEWEKEQIITYPYMLRDAREQIRKLLSEGADTDEICSQISEECTRIDPYSKKYKPFAYKFLPKSAIIRIIAEETDRDFWEIYNDILSKLKYKNISERIAEEAVRKYPTEQFMIISKDLMLYRLDSLKGTTDILQSWISDWKEKYDKAIATVSKPINTIKLVDALCEAYDAFDNVIMFRDTFLELIENSSDDRYMALFQLFADVLNEEMAVLSEDDKLILNADDPSKEAVRRREGHVDIGNRKLNMLLELMYNRKLRESVFGV